MAPKYINQYALMMSWVMPLAVLNCDNILWKLVVSAWNKIYACDYDGKSQRIFYLKTQFFLYLDITAVDIYNWNFVTVETNYNKI